MKKRVAFIFMLLLCTGAVLMSCRSSRKVSSARWKLVWQENFNQKRGFDTHVWSKIPRGRSDWNKKMTDLDSCFDMRKGNLILRGIVNQDLSGDSLPYLTGGVYTCGKKLFSEGRIEVCAKLNTARGAWPAIWMLPEDGEWVQGGEIDIMERLNYDHFVYQTVHSDYTEYQGIKDNPAASSTGPIKPDDYNVFAVEIYGDSLSFYVNDIHTFTYPRIRTDKKGQFPYSGHSFYLLIDMQLGGGWVGEVDLKELPVEMCVDWVRYYSLTDKNKW